MKLLPIGALRSPMLVMVRSLALPLVVAAAMTGVAGAAYAQAPALVPAQGVLYEEGEPIEGTLDVHFTIYVGAALTPVWTETQEVRFQRGLFSVYLGQVNPLSTTIFAENTSVFLGVRVDGDTEMQMIRMGTVPYAGYADAAGRATTAGLADRATLADNATNATNADRATSAALADRATLADNATSADRADSAALADRATLADDASLLGGRTRAQVVDETLDAAGSLFSLLGHTHAFSELTGVPAGLADGDDDTLARLTCTAGQIARFSGGVWACSNDDTGGDIDGVSAGTGLTGGGATGSVALALDTTFTDNRYVNVGEAIAANTIAAPAGCTTGQVLQRTASGWGCVSLPELPVVSTTALRANGSVLSGVTSGRAYLVTVYGYTSNRGTDTATLGALQLASGSAVLNTPAGSFNWPDGNAPLSHTAVFTAAATSITASIDGGSGTVLWMSAWPLPYYP